MSDIYKPNDFSVIHSATSRPETEGWYCTEHRISAKRHKQIHEGITITMHEFHMHGDFNYWTGTSWKVAPYDKYNMPFQDYPWFGLNTPSK